jgi:uncharacterized protein YceH (UPF0502 family)
MTPDLRPEALLALADKLDSRAWEDRQHRELRGKAAATLRALAAQPQTEADRIIIDDCNATIKALGEQVKELQQECFSLAAGTCIIDGGLVGDDGGTPYCTMKKRAEAAEAEVASLRAKLAEAESLIAELRSKTCHD